MHNTVERHIALSIKYIELETALMSKMYIHVSPPLQV